MSKALRIGFTVIAVLVIGLIAAVAVFVYTVDYNRHKGLIEKAVMDATGRQLEIKGDLAIALSLPPELAVGDVTLANAPWGSQPQMAHIGQLRVRIRLIPLLMREIDITGIRLIDTDLLLETDASGRANWRFEQAADSRSGAGMRDVAVKHLEVEQFAVTLRRGGTGAPAARYKLDHLELTRSAAGDSLGVELQGSLRGQAIELNLKGSGNDLAELSAIADQTLPQTGPFALNGRLTGSGEALVLSEAQGTVSHQSMKVSLTGRIDELIALKGVSLNVKGAGNNLGELRSVLTDKLPDTGPYSVTARLSGSARALAGGMEFTWEFIRMFAIGLFLCRPAIGHAGIDHCSPRACSRQAGRLVKL